jgi:hypothetical protein
MSLTQHSAQSNEQSEEGATDAFTPTPDEDGPHDVPDEMVIEKTLPSVPVPDLGKSG